MRHFLTDLALPRSAGIIARKIVLLLTSVLSINLLGALAHAAQDQTISQLVKQTQGTQLLVIGEMHGTEETPALVADIVEHLTSENAANGNGQPIVVALEYPQTEEDILTDYFNSDGGQVAKRRLLDSPFWSRAAQDGRSSQGVLALIDSLRRHHRRGLDIHLAVFDMNADQIAARQNRDLAMATNLRAIVQANGSARVIVLTGNYHARQQDGAPWDSAYRFMVSYLKDLAPFSLKVDAYYGKYWGCSGPDAVSCKVVSFARNANEHRPLGLSFDAETKAIGYNQALMLDRFSPSIPANKAN